MIHYQGASSASIATAVTRPPGQMVDPYAQAVDPHAAARRTIESLRPMGPTANTQWAPEEIAMAAQRVAEAAAAGTAIPRYTDQAVVRAAKMILEGRHFVIRSAGRAIEIRVKQMPSYEALVAMQPASYMVR